eukprot:TRINITY_DN786_c0_g1_i1.p1 TRINITY_DN786_c0_g1~~TRINITY_DN786_c0_g1_i1.p1  ORF type:complete len:557 (+),score=240.72 TRINITY_DN786_c0_g1_i1:157-1671(+)
METQKKLESEKPKKKVTKSLAPPPGVLAPPAKPMPPKSHPKSMKPSTTATSSDPFPAIPSSTPLPIQQSNSTENTNDNTSTTKSSSSIQKSSTSTQQKHSAPPMFSVLDADELKELQSQRDLSTVEKPELESMLQQAETKHLTLRAKVQQLQSLLENQASELADTRRALKDANNGESSEGTMSVARQSLSVAMLRTARQRELKLVRKVIRLKGGSDEEAENMMNATEDHYDCEIKRLREVAPIPSTQSKAEPGLSKNQSARKVIEAVLMIVGKDELKRKLIQFRDKMKNAVAKKKGLPVKEDPWKATMTSVMSKISPAKPKPPTMQRPAAPATPLVPKTKSIKQSQQQQPEAEETPIKSKSVSLNKDDLDATLRIEELSRPVSQRARSSKKNWEKAGSVGRSSPQRRQKKPASALDSLYDELVASNSNTMTAADRRKRQSPFKTTLKAQQTLKAWQRTKRSTASSVKNTRQQSPSLDSQKEILEKQVRELKKMLSDVSQNKQRN